MSHKDKVLERILSDYFKKGIAEFEHQYIGDVDHMAAAENLNYITKVHDRVNFWSIINLDFEKSSNKTRIRPTGYYVLVEVDVVEETHEGTSIVMLNDERTREAGGRDIGTIVEFGPICFQGYADCKKPSDWGCKVGDKVEFNRYDGKTPRLAESDPELANLRIINDNDIIAVMEAE